MLSAIYRVLSSALPFVGVLNLLWRSRNQPEYRTRIRERFGFTPTSVGTGAVWIHAVSAGELIAAETLINRLLDAPEPPRLLITTTTPTGSAEVQRRFKNRVDHCYMPFDASRCITRFVNRTKPTALILMETEIWPNLLRIANKQGIKVCLANARLSERSARRYRYVRAMTRSMLRRLDLIVSQYQATTDRFIDLGFPPSHIHTTGTMKFDIEISDQTRSEISRIGNLWPRHEVSWIAASTHPGEEEVALDAHLIARGQVPDLSLILAPRHPHRSEAIANLARARGLSVAKLSECDPSAEVLVVDQMGVLMAVYGLAKAAFIGGSLQRTGGHNPIEAAVFGLPLLMGPDRHNFEEVCQRFEAIESLITVHNSKDLANQVCRLINGDEKHINIGERVKRVVAENQGATQRQFEIVSNWLKEC